MPETPCPTPVGFEVVTKMFQKYGESTLHADMLVRFGEPGVVELDGYATDNQLPQSADVVPISDD